MMLPEMQLPLLAENPKAKVFAITQADELFLALPVQSTGSHDRSTTSDFTCSSLPLVAQGMSQETVLALVNQLQRPILLRDMALDCQFYQQLKLAGGQIQLSLIHI